MQAKPTLERKFIIVRWHYTPTADAPKRYPESKHAREFYPITEDSFGSIDEVARDVASGQIEDMAQAVEIDLDAGTSCDVTADVEAEANAIMAERQDDEEQRYRYGGRW